jgi:hypothetical protein
MAIINGVGRVGIRNYVSPVQASYLLDAYGGAATAYSLRKLSSTYAGFAIRVRRSSDNTEQNIGFDSSGNLDTTALLSFVGSGNGFVTTWYDQSTAVKTMIQPTATSQPTIVSAGSLISRNGKPIIKFNSTNHLYMSGSVSFDSSNHSFFMTYEKDSMTNKAILIMDSYSYLFLDYNTAITNGNNVFYVSIPTNSFKLISLTNTWVTSRKFYMNNSVLATGSGSSAGGCSFATIASPSYTQGTIYTNEVVTYANDQVSNIDSINSNINSYYSIYPTYTSRTTAFAAATGITDTTILNALNTFDTGLISNGLATKMKALYPMVGGTATTHKFNFMDARDVDAAFRIQFNGGWTHPSTGALPNGSNAYANTFFNPKAQNVNKSNFGVSYYSRTNNLGSYIDFGAVASDQTYIYGAPRFDSTTDVFRMFDDGSAGTGNYATRSDGFFTVQRDSATTQKVIQNGSQIGQRTGSGASADIDFNIFLAARNLWGNPGVYSNRQNAFTAIHDAFTLAEATKLYNLVQALQTSLSRAV